MRQLFVPALLTLPLLGVLPGCQTNQQKLTTQGISEYKAGNYPAAEATFNQVLKKNESNAQANYYAGMAAYQQKKLETAAYHLKLAWSMDPSMGEVKDALTEVLIRQGYPDRALDFLERDAKLTAATHDPRALKTNSKAPYVYQTEENMFVSKANDRCRVARVYEKLGDMDNAALNYDHARQMAPNSPAILLAVGQFYARVGQKEKAASAFEKAYNIDPKYPGLVEAISQSNMTIK